MRFTLLGTGTSTGVPTVSCHCATCQSTDWRDKRKRSSLLAQFGNTNLVIDTTPDFRSQMIDSRVDHLDAILYTHSHFDHIGGFDDIRAFNFTQRKPMPVYLNQRTLKDLKRTFIYAFERPEQIGGGVPEVDVKIISKESFEIDGVRITPIPLMHGNIGIFGYRIGNFSYCTDASYISAESIELLQGTEVLVLNALRYAVHPTHFSIDQALEIVETIRPKKTYFTHISHEIKHEDCEKKLPENVFLGYDGLIIDVEDK